MHKRIKRHLADLLQIPGDWRRRISSKREQGLATWAGSTPLQRFSTALLTAAVVVGLAVVVIGEGGDIASDITVSADEGLQTAADDGDVDEATTSTPPPDVIAPVLDTAAPVTESVVDPTMAPAPLIVPSLISDVEPRTTEKPKTKVAGKSVSRSTTTTTPRRVVAPNRNFSLLFAVPSPAPAPTAAPTPTPAPAPAPTRPPSSSPVPTPVTVPPLFPTTTRPVTTTTQPVTVPPTTRPVVTVPPTTAAPTTAAPTTAAPTTAAPTTAAPTTAAPTTAAPTTAAPTTAAPTTAAPPTTEAPPAGD